MRLALVPPHASVLPPGAGNELKKPIKARERAKKREEGYAGERVVVDRDMDTAPIGRHDDGDAAAAWTGAKVKVTGKIEEYGGKVESMKGRPQIILQNPEQVTIVEAAPAK